MEAVAAMFTGKILIDADACPVKQLVRAEAQKRGIPLIMVADDSHLLQDDYATVVTVSQGADAADYNRKKTAANWQKVA